MAKNLKLNIKNAQLAKAMNIGKKKETQPKASSAAVEEKPKPRKAIRKAITKDEHGNIQSPEPTKVEKTEAAPPSPAASPAPAPEEKAPKKTEGLRRVEIVERKPKEAKEKTEKEESNKKLSPVKDKPVKLSEQKKKEFREKNSRLKTGPKSRFDSRDKQGLREREEGNWRRRRPHRKNKFKKRDEPIIRPTELTVKIPITIKELAGEMKLKASEIIAKLFLQGLTLTLNDYLDDETTIQLIGEEFGCTIAIDTSEEERLRITEKTIGEEIQETEPDMLSGRAPVVAFMGHVDHGKTSLIDALRKSNLASGEAGAITQHIGAFRCHLDKGEITILDTPGHEAFSEMRSRGATVTDIVILVVAGDEGIKPQTDEAIAQAREAGAPIVVAINKCDKPGFDANEVYRQLSERELLPEAWGGDTITVNCSAVSGEGMEQLLEMTLLQAEVLELKANSKTRARGTVLESSLHQGLGIVATVLVQNGTLKKNDALVFESEYGRVKTMHDEHGRDLKEAGPSHAVRITGISDVPGAGAEFIVVGSEKEAKKLTEGRTAGRKRAALQHIKKEQIESILRRNQEMAEKKVLKIILRADVQGSLEALSTSLMKIPSDKVELSIISSDVGKISESDVELAKASGAPLVAFHTGPAPGVEDMIEKEKIKYVNHDIIYHLIDDVKVLMADLLDKVREEHEMGAAEVRAVFKSSGLGNIAGCQVTDGIMKRSHIAKLYRDGELHWEGDFASLKRVKEDVKEVSKGLECGILLKNNSDIKEGDIIKAFDVTYKKQEL